MRTLKIPFTITLIVTFGFAFFFSQYLTVQKKQNKVYSSSSPKGMKYKKGRTEYFNRLLRDPKTNEIPKNIRQRELEFAKELNNRNKSLQKSNVLEWKEAGPNDVGGRTRALAVDVTNSNMIIAGGASGGIWKSINKGVSWSLKSSTSQILSVTSVAQDPRPGNTNIWYYASGEFRSSTADQGQTHIFSGGGIYKSVDNGETWNLQDQAKDTDPTSFNTPYDFVSKIIVSPTTGSVFIASHPFGILKSSNGGSNFNLVLGGTNEHIYSDIDVTENGTLIAVVSSPFSGFNPSNTPGVYKSINDGANWTNITPGTFPAEHFRSVIEAANNNTAYVLTFTGNFVDDKYDDVRFHKINIVNGTSVDRSANMPNFNQDFEDYINTQQNYNMVVAAKPDNEDFVIIGGTSLFRSTNGFSSKPISTKLDWIGGYHPQAFFYPGFHPDVHSFAFDPNNPNAMWWGHDGGLSYTDNITTNNYASYFPWFDKNNGYNVTQFYMVAIPNEASDNRILGGTQDNGTPYFRFNGTTTTESEDLSSGDGSYGYWGDNFCYVSVQNGVVLRVNYDGSGNPSRSNGWSNITPQNASNQLFINPYVVNPNNENIMLYPAGNVLWRNNQLNSLPTNLSFEQGISVGWTQLSNASAPAGYVISALSFTENNPQHRLYYSAVDFSQSPSSPKLYRLDNAHTTTSSPIDISINGLNGSSYIHNIAVNPDNGNELLVIISNYNVVGIYHSLNGGNSFTAVEGNLEGDQNNPGPSIRGASIIPTSNGTEYFVGTTTGVYSTTQLNGGTTSWVQEGSNSLGNVIVNYIASRKSDGRIVAGTHGRGAFVAEVGMGGNAVATVNVTGLTLQSRPGESGSTTFTLSNTGNAAMNYNISVTGSFGSNLPKSNKKTYKLNSKSKVISSENKEKLKEQKLLKASSSSLNKINPSDLITNIEGDDYLVLDDSNSISDTFVGFGPDGFGGANLFKWKNEFNITGFDYDLDGFDFYMRTEGSLSNSTKLELLDSDLNVLESGTLDLDLSDNDGNWYSITLDPPVSFKSGETFFISIESDNDIEYPAGADYDATIPNKSFYHNGSSWTNLNTVSGFENAAFLIRATGTKRNGYENVLTVSPASGSIAAGNSQLVTLTLNAQNISEGTYTGEVNIISSGGNITIPIDYLVDIEKESLLSNEYHLNQNYPNPFNPRTIINYSIADQSQVLLIVYDALGREVTTLVNKQQNPGIYQVEWNAENFSSGIYYYKLTVDEWSDTKKMILLR
jgi:hypothetical protein